jgi:hypothetical protein
LVGTGFGHHGRLCHRRFGSGRCLIVYNDGASTGTETVSAEVVTVLSFTSSVMTEATC